MDIKEAREEINRNTAQILPAILPRAKQNVNGKPSYICPICGHGSHGDGLAIDPQSKKGGVKCFGCGFSGDTIDLIEKMEGLADREAVLRLASIIGLNVDTENGSGQNTHEKAPNSAGTSKTDNSTREPSKAEIEAVTEGKTENTPGLYRERCQLFAAAAGSTDYFKRRGLSDDTIKKCGLGYDESTNSAVFPYNGEYSYYSRRVVTEKAYRKPKREDAGPEPVYNPEALYNGRPCFVTEAPFDALSVIEAGGNACAIGGTGYGKLIKQIITRRPASPVILCFDNDPPNEHGSRPGPEAQKKCAAELSALGIPYTEAAFSWDQYGGRYKDTNELLIDNRELFIEDVERITREAEENNDAGQFLKTVFSKKYEPIETGVSGLDNVLNGGLIRQTLVLLGGPPGGAKTVFAGQLFESMAKAGHPCLYYNLEMSREQLEARSIARLLHCEYDTNISAVDVLQAYKQPEHIQEKIREAARRYYSTIGGHLQYNPIDTVNLTTILKNMNDAAALAIQYGRPAPIVCLDYLQILTGDGHEDSTEIIKRAVAGLKSYAIKYNTVVLAITAQSRVANESRKASQTAGRDSSALEYSADLQLQLIREDPTDDNEITLHVTKSRFTQCKMKEGLKFTLLGAQSYLAQRGEWVQSTLEETPFADDKKGAGNGSKTGGKRSGKKGKYSFST